MYTQGDSNSTQVSVIVPTYNSGRYLREAIESLLNTHYTNLQIMIVDDGSSDDSLSQAKILAQEHDNILVSTHPGNVNKGIGATRNYGVAISTGSYVCFLDADDYVLPNRFTTCVKILDECPDVDAVCEATQRIVEPGAEWRAKHVRPITRFDCTNPDDVLKLRIEGKLAWHANAVLIRRESFKLVGGFEESFSLADDAVLWLKLASKCKIVGGSQEPVCVYRLHVGNSSHELYSRPRAISTEVFIRALTWAKKSDIDLDRVEMLSKGLEAKLFHECDNLRRMGMPIVCMHALLKSVLVLPRLLVNGRYLSNLLFAIYEFFLQRKTGDCENRK